MYMSEKNLYIASGESINEWEISQDVTVELVEPKLTAADKTLIQKIKDTDDEVLSQQEKRSKIYEVYNQYVQFMNSDEQSDLQKKVDERVKKELEKYESMQYTIINRIDLESFTLAATGEVPGSLSNQFAMDEQDNVLRVATTLQESYWRSFAVEVTEKMIAPRQTTTNNVYTLDMSLAVIGTLKGLGDGEQIYSTRFMGDRLYLVTFRQVDPFYVIDLSNPRSPKTLGELKIPGFSRYLHPYDENTIIGIGRDATDLGRQQGLKISLFDVTDVAKPKEIAKFVAESQYSQSTAEYEHKAFLFDKDKELLVIPIYSYDWESKGAKQYNGAMVFRIKPGEITMRGIIDHSGGQQLYGPSVERSLWIDDLLYTKSPNLLRVNRLDTLASTANVTLTQANGSPYPVY
jgi:uncharacterized secreted protein with C-terminal beta-propeller domain